MSASPEYSRLRRRLGVVKRGVTLNQKRVTALDRAVRAVPPRLKHTRVRLVEYFAWLLGFGRYEDGSE